MLGSLPSSAPGLSASRAIRFLIEAVECGEIEQIRRGIITGVGMCPHAERGLDLYETPPEATRALVDVESFDGTIWECANGRSAISRVLREAGYRVIATDIADYGCPDARQVSGAGILSLVQ
jgi:hypothetical protein